MVGLIIACEIGFWAILLAGLLVRYPLRRPYAGMALLLCVPLVDLVLLGASSIHLRSGAQAEWADGLAALYLGFSLAFGHAMIRWADRQVAWRLGGGPRPPRVKRYGREELLYEWREFLRVVLACGTSAALLLGGIVLVGDPERAAPLVAWLGELPKILLVALIWPMSALVWPRKPPKEGTRPL